MPAKSKTLEKKRVSSTSSRKIDGRVSIDQVEKALSALIKHREKSRNTKDNDLPINLADDMEGEGSRSDRSDVAWMQITVKRLNANAPIKAIRLWVFIPGFFLIAKRRSLIFILSSFSPVPHAIWSDSSSICLLTADPQRKYKDLIVEEKLTQIKRVVGVTKLKGKFKPFEARRQLMNEHEIFLADDRIVNMLPKLLGKKWIESRKWAKQKALDAERQGNVFLFFPLSISDHPFLSNWLERTMAILPRKSIQHFKRHTFTETKEPAREWWTVFPLVRVL